MKWQSNGYPLKGRKKEQLEDAGKEGQEAEEVYRVVWQPGVRVFRFRWAGFRTEEAMKLIPEGTGNSSRPDGGWGLGVEVAGREAARDEGMVGRSGCYLE